LDTEPFELKPDSPEPQKRKRRRGRRRGPAQNGAPAGTADQASGIAASTDPGPVSDQPAERPPRRPGTPEDRPAAREHRPPQRPPQHRTDDRRGPRPPQDQRGYRTGDAQRGGGGRPGGSGPDRGGRDRDRGRILDRPAGAAPATGPEQAVAGLLELTGGGGMLRSGALASSSDASVPGNLIRSIGLRSGDLVEAVARGGTVVTVERVNGEVPVELAARRNFTDLTAVHPDKALILGPTPDAITGRLLDIVAPVGRGQRGLIVAPPKAGKTTLLRDIALGAGRDPNITLITLLVAERPEEVTDLRRAVPGMVLAADLDMPPTAHIRVAALGIDHAKRLVEQGRHVVVLLDSLTRLARAHNLALKGTSRTLSGGMDAAALQPVRQVFGAARAAEEGGSLTILATCLIDTGSKMDDLVYEEFKGTGNMEVILDRGLAERRLFPAIDIGRSGTRREELLLEPEMLQYVTEVRRQLAGAPPDQALTALLDALRRMADRSGG
jgi:transcription termination factor Rho